MVRNWRMVLVGTVLLVSGRTTTSTCWMPVPCVTMGWWLQAQGPQPKPTAHKVGTWWRHQMETFSTLLAFVRAIHRSPVNSPHKGQWRVALVFSLICAWINGWVNNREAGNLRHPDAHYDVTIMTRHHEVVGLVLLLLSDAVASLLTNGTTAFKWRLHCHWSVVQQHQTAV